MIGDDVAAALPELRAQAESAMVDAVIVETVVGETLNENNEVVPEYGPVYAGKCRLVPTDFKDFEKSAGETSFDAADVKLVLPITVESGKIRNGDRATLTVAVNDPANVGRVFTVQRDPVRSFPVERRFSCQEVS